MMGRGINLGNTLEPPFEGAWNNPLAQEYYFDDYVSAGFSTVRIPVRWDQHTGTSVPYAVSSSWLSRVEEIVDWGLSRGLIVIINAHHEDWLKQNYSPSNQARFDSIWTQVATHFSGKSEKLWMEIINEPQGLTRPEVDALNARVLGIIRDTNPTRIVIIAGNGWAAAADLMAAAIPDDDYLMGYYHSYDPWDFAGLAQRGWGTTADRAAVRSTFQSVKAWSASNNLPVMMSEGGAIHANEHNDRMKFYAAYVEESVDAGIPFQVWDDGGDFRVYDRANRAWPEVKDILIHAYPDGPTDIGMAVHNDSVVVVSWRNRYAFASGTAVQRAVAGGEFETLADISGSAESYDDEMVAGGLTYDYRVIARNALGPDKYSYPQRYTVPLFTRSPYTGTALPVPGVIQAEDYDVGGEGLTYHDSDAVNTPGAYRASSGVDIEARDDGGWQVTGIEPGEWLEYTLDVQTAGTYTLTAHVASMEGLGRFMFTFDGVSSPALRTPKTDSWQTTQPVSVSVDLTAGKQFMRLSIMNVAHPFNLDRFELELAGSTGTNPNPKRPDLELYPNPAGDALRVQGSTPGQAEILDLLGRRVLEERVLGNSVHLDTSALPGGVYFLRLIPASGTPSVHPFVRR